MQFRDIPYIANVGGKSERK